jgi:hypothetical protein
MVLALFATALLTMLTTGGVAHAMVSTTAAATTSMTTTLATTPAISEGARMIEVEDHSTARDITSQETPEMVRARTDLARAEADLARAAAENKRLEAENKRLEAEQP